MAREFSASVEYGLQLTGRTYSDKKAPPETEKMSKSASETYLPTAVMVYAMVYNPDEPSSQQSVCGRPALIPLHMQDVCMKVDCCMDTAFVTVTGMWIVHCVEASKRCDCQIAVPMGEQGSLLDVEIDIPGPGAGKSYYSQWVKVGDAKETVKVPRAGDGRFLKPHLYTFSIPQVEGCSKLSIKAGWSQKLLYQKGQFCLNVPFTFPVYVVPVDKTPVSKREKIVLNLNSGIATEISHQCTSHSLKELRREVGTLSFMYEAEVEAWSGADFNFSYTVSSRDMMGGVLLQSQQLNNLNSREMFCFYLFPGNKETRKVFRKEVVFIIDNSQSMQGAPVESVKTAVSACLSKLGKEDFFNLISFNGGETCLFPSKMEQATDGSKSQATRWLEKLTVGAGTNFLSPIEQAMKLLADASGSIPLIFLITDGTADNEKMICNVMKDLSSRGLISPRICTFGIGPYCNHYFLQMLAQIGRGHYDCAYDADSIGSRLERLFTKASSIILANITISTLEHLDGIELFPSHIPDLSFENPLIVSGTYKGDFPGNIQVSGILADMTNFVTDLKVQNVKDVLPFDRVFARQQIDALTAQAWLDGNKELEEKVATISLQTSYPSEYTSMVLFRAEGEKKAPEPVLQQEILNKINKPLTKGDASSQEIIFLGCLGVGFGNLSATAKNKPPLDVELESPDGADKPAGKQLPKEHSDRGIMRVLKYLDLHHCIPVFSQICAGLACFECCDSFDCFECCYNLCCCCCSS